MCGRVFTEDVRAHVRVCCVLACVRDVLRVRVRDCPYQYACLCACVRACVCMRAACVRARAYVHAACKCAACVHAARECVLRAACVHMRASTRECARAGVCASVATVEPLHVHVHVCMRASAHASCMRACLRTSVRVCAPSVRACECERASERVVMRHALCVVRRACVVCTCVRARWGCMGGCRAAGERVG